jgi:hypothetical protein
MTTPAATSRFLFRPYPLVLSETPETLVPAELVPVELQAEEDTRAHVRRTTRPASKRVDTSFSLQARLEKEDFLDLDLHRRCRHPICLRPIRLDLQGNVSSR